MIIRCNHCNEIIEYDEMDIEVGGDMYGMMEMFITCPECGKTITIGTYPSTMAIINMDNGTGGVEW